MYTLKLSVCVCVCVCGDATLVELALGGVRARARVPWSVNSRTGPAPYAGYQVRLPKFMHGTPARTPGTDRYGVCVRVCHIWSFGCVLQSVACITNTYTKHYKKNETTLYTGV